MNKKKKNLFKLIIQLLIATGTLLTGLASLIQALRWGEGRKPQTFINILIHLKENEKSKI